MRVNCRLREIDDQWHGPLQCRDRIRKARRISAGAVLGGVCSIACVKEEANLSPLPKGHRSETAGSVLLLLRRETRGPCAGAGFGYGSDICVAEHGCDRTHQFAIVVLRVPPARPAAEP